MPDRAKADRGAPRGTAQGTARGTPRVTEEDPDVAQVVEAVLASSRALVALSARSIADAKGVTLPQYRMLVVLDQRPTNLTGLAAALDVAPSTALRMIDRLVSAGLVERTTPAENRRETHLAVTRTGRRTVRTVTERRRRDLYAVIAQIPPHQRADVAAAMTAFAAAAEQIYPIQAPAASG